MVLKKIADYQNESIQSLIKVKVLRIIMNYWILSKFCIIILKKSVFYYKRIKKIRNRLKLKLEIIILWVKLNSSKNFRKNS